MSICEFIISLYPSTPEKVQAWCSVGLLGTAIYGFNTWKKQEKHKAIVELLKELYITYRVFLELRKNVYPDFRALNDDVVKEKFKHTMFEGMRFKIQKKRIKSFESHFHKIERFAGLAIANLEEKNAVRQYYVRINDLINNIIEENWSYGIHAKVLSETIESQIEVKKYLGELAVPNFKFSQSIHKTKYNTREEAKAAYESKLKEYQDKIDFCKNKLEELKPVIFNIYSIGTTNTIHDEIEDLFNKAIIFRNRYQNPGLSRSNT